MLKKTLAILCALTLLVSMFSVGYIASATETTMDECYTIIESEDFENVTLPSDLVYGTTTAYNKNFIEKDNCYWFTTSHLQLNSSDDIAVYPDVSFLTFSANSGIAAKNKYAMSSMDYKAASVEVINSAMVGTG